MPAKRNDKSNNGKRKSSENESEEKQGSKKLKNESVAQCSQTNQSTYESKSTQTTVSTLTKEIQTNDEFQAKNNQTIKFFESKSTQTTVSTLSKEIQTDDEFQAKNNQTIKAFDSKSSKTYMPLNAEDNKHEITIKAKAIETNEKIKIKENEIDETDQPCTSNEMRYFNLAENILKKTHIGYCHRCKSKNPIYKHEYKFTYDFFCSKCNSDFVEYLD